MVSATQSQGEAVRFPRLQRAVRILVLIAFPASLASPGITIPMALALYVVVDIAFNMDPLSAASAVAVGLMPAYGTRAHA